MPKHISRRRSTTPAQLRKIIERGNDKQRQNYNSAVNAARAVRQSKGKVSRKEAAKQYGISVSTMNRYAGSILHMTNSGQFATPDNLPTLVQIPESDGPKYRILSGPKQLNWIGAYREAVKEFLAKGSDETISKLNEFDTSVGVGRDRVKLITDPQELKRLYGIYGDELLDPGSGQYGYPEKKAA